MRHTISSKGIIYCIVLFRLLKEENFNEVNYEREI